MKAPKTLVVVGLALAVGLAAAYLVFNQPPAVRQTARQAIQLNVAPTRTPEQASPIAEPTAAPPAVAETSPPVAPAPAHDISPPPKPAKAVARPKQGVLDPTARVALSFVGADPEGEAYWYGAINDPSLSAHERQDLIEDLNEDGLSDPRRPDPEDLPLIRSRLALIEEVAPYAMDQVNADAFQEAYQDLVNMYDRLAKR